MECENGVVFEDYFPAMMERLGGEGFMKELCNGFRMLRDGEKGVVTFESLKKSLGLLGLGELLSDEEVMCMIKEGDLDGDGCLNEMDFCTLMFRLSPALMETSNQVLKEAVISHI
ncbi:hypothetical protein UlMin_011707 [Ulmus minor]